MRKFYSKVLLFGEYTVLEGSSALTIPFKKFSGYFKISGSMSKSEYESNQVLSGLHKYLEANISRLSVNVDLTRFRKDIENGMFFYSSIPIGYGLGSSGALVAAFFEKYCNISNIEKSSDFYLLLNKEMAIIESYFHGNSSGIDPLSIFIGKPLFIEKSTFEQLDVQEIKQQLGNFYLMDTGNKSGTAYLVNEFKNRMKDNNFRSLLYEELIPANNSGIRSLIESNNDVLRTSINAISFLQFNYFKNAIPPAIQDYWQDGLKSEEFFMKLCGSGGGGNVLVWSEKPNYKLEEKLNVKMQSIQIDFNVSNQ